MAEGKKSVLLYCDLIHTIEKMDDATAGQFFKHYLRYINDLDPETNNLIVDLTFESVKQNLKRDLKKWEVRAEKSRENGKKGGRPKTQKTKQVISKPRKPVKDTVTVTVTDTGNVSVNDTIEVVSTPSPKTTVFNFKNSLIQEGFESYLVDDWLKVRSRKKASNTKTAFNGFIREVKKSNEDKNKILETCVVNSWSGFKAEWYTNLNKSNNGNTPKSRDEINRETNDAREREIMDKIRGQNASSSKEIRPESNETGYQEYSDWTDVP